jgi:hypothetical protein
MGPNSASPVRPEASAIPIPPSSIPAHCELSALDTAVLTVWGRGVAPRTGRLARL